MRMVNDLEHAAWGRSEKGRWDVTNSNGISIQKMSNYSIVVLELNVFSIFSMIVLLSIWNYHWKTSILGSKLKDASISTTKRKCIFVV